MNHWINEITKGIFVLSNKVVIQKIDPDTGKVELYQNYDLKSPWSFESYRNVSQNDPHPDIFPFLFSDSERFHIGVAGSETTVHKTKDGSLLFADDYAVPEGFVIAFLFPKGFYPEVFKFKDKPYIPVGVGLTGASVHPPGHFELYVNKREQLSAVVFLVTSSTYFGFKCIAKNCSKNYPSKDRFAFYDDLFASVGFEESHPIKILSGDLEAYKEHFSPKTDLDRIASLLNDLIALHKKNDSVEQRNTITNHIRESLSTSSSTVTIIDSYSSGNSVSVLVSKIIAYLTL